MKEDYVQGAPLLLHTQLHTHSEPYTTAAVKDCPLFARGLSLPVAVVWGTKYPHGAKG